MLHRICLTIAALAVLAVAQTVSTPIPLATAPAVVTVPGPAIAPVAAPAATPANTLPAALESVTLPTNIMIGMSYNQFTGAAGLISALEPESQSLTLGVAPGLYASESADLTPVKYVNPSTGKTGYLVAGSMRFGQHKVLLNTAQPGSTFHPSFLLAIGADAGASFASTPTAAGTPATSVSVGFSGSFTLSAFYRFKPHWAAGVAVRALYMSGIGPNGIGAWNPVLEPGLVYSK